MKNKCKQCGKTKEIVARGLCNACYCKIQNTGELKKFVKVRPDNSKKRKCEDCERVKKIYANNRCRVCYDRTTVITKMINGKQLKIRIPFGDKLKALKYFDKKKKELLDDLESNPRKWLEEKKEDAKTNKT